MLMYLKPRDIYYIIVLYYEKSHLYAFEEFIQSVCLGDTTPTYLETEEDLEKWESAFETIYVSRLDILNDLVLKERMRFVLDNSQHCDISLLRSVRKFAIFLIILIPFFTQ